METAIDFTPNDHDVLQKQRISDVLIVLSALTVQMTVDDGST